MSNYSKGKRTEKIAEDELRRQGFDIFFKSVFVRFHNIDFGAWDIVGAKRMPDGELQWRFVQCSSWANRSQKMKICKAWMEEYFLEGMSGFLVLKKGKEIIWELI